MNRFFILHAILIAVAQPAAAKVNVITTIPDLRVIVAEVGGDHVTVSSIAKGTQDPHFIEAKPSYMTKIHNAQLVIAIGLDLESAWLKPVIQGARNPNIRPGQDGYLEVGPLVDPSDKATAGLTRADGDVHPHGNPHVTLDPLRAGKIAVKIAERLSRFDAVHEDEFKNRAEAFQRRLEEKTKSWQARVRAAGVTRIITYHKTLSYFLARFGIENPAVLEPKPGIPPTSSHIMKVIEIIKIKKVPLILVENYFDTSVTKKIKNSAPEIRVETVPVAVEGAPHAGTLEDLYETLVRAIEGQVKR